MPQGLNKGATLQNGTYRIEEVLGQGTFGITYLAVHMRLNKKIAIKEFFMGELNSRQADSQTVEGSSGSIFTDYRRKFRREAENLANLRHPNIVNVSDIFDENGTTYYVMDFIEGTNLDRYIGAKGHLSEKDAIEATIEIGKALEYMHSKRMLHLDIKPSNVMRDADGRYLLIDFGLSKHFSEDGVPEETTSIGLGTEGYAPIEQGLYKQTGTFPATLDVYALGATMYKMLTGERPPKAAEILNIGFPSEILSAKGVSKKLIDIVSKSMEPGYKHRYQSINEFLKELNRLLGITTTEPITLPPYTRPKEDIQVVYGGPLPIDFDDPKSQSEPTPTGSILMSVIWIMMIVGLIIGMVYDWKERLSYGSVYCYWLADCIIMTIFAGIGLVRPGLFRKYKLCWFGLFIPSMLNPLLWDPNWYWEWLAEIVIFAPLLIFSSKFKDKYIRLIMVAFAIFASLMIFGF